MKKLSMFLVFLAVGMLVVPGSAFCDYIDDPENDHIGAACYAVSGMDVTQVGNDITVLIDTALVNRGFPGSKTIYGDGGMAWTTFAGDLAIDLGGDGTYDFGVAFTQHKLKNDVRATVGQLYDVDTSVGTGPNVYQGWHTSNFYNPGSGFLWNPDEIVTMRVATAVAGAVYAVNWDDAADQIGVTLDATDFLPAGFDGDIVYRWATGTCANDIVQGGPALTAVPEPATVFLVGCGLVGLAGLGRRKSSRR